MPGGESGGIAGRLGGGERPQNGGRGVEARCIGGRRGGERVEKVEKWASGDLGEELERGREGTSAEKTTLECSSDGTLYQNGTENG